MRDEAFMSGSVDIVEYRLLVFHDVFCRLPAELGTVIDN